MAPTGTGKTAAYVVPILAQLIHARSAADRPSGAVAVILAPIRELAIQIEDATKLLARGIPHMRTALLVGGVPMPPQLHRLQTGVQVVVATPGRFLDIFSNYEIASSAADAEGSADEDAGHTTRTPTSLAATIVCVVDEVDVMLDVGFRAQICQIVGMLPPLSQLQMLFLSATLSSRVEALVQQILGGNSYLRIEVGGKTKMKKQAEDGSGVRAAAASTTYTVNANIRQTVAWAEDRAKKKVLFDLLESKSGESTVRISAHMDAGSPPVILTRSLCRAPCSSCLSGPRSARRCSPTQWRSRRRSLRHPSTQISHKRNDCARLRRS